MLGAGAILDSGWLSSFSPLATDFCVLASHPLTPCFRLPVASCPLQVDTNLQLAAPDTRHLTPGTYSSSLRSLSALLITDTELKVMAAAASIGLSSSPHTG